VFEFTEYNPSSHSDETVSIFDASLIYDLNRCKKLYLWHPFFDSLFQELKDNDLNKRWEQIRRCAAETGAERIIAYVDCKNNDVLEAREFCVNELEGVDVFAPKSILTERKHMMSTTYDELLGSDNHFRSKTCFAKLYTQPFPLRAFIVFDDADSNTAVLYDDGITKLAAANKTAEAKNMILLRKQLRCLAAACFPSHGPRPRSSSRSPSKRSASASGEPKIKYEFTEQKTMRVQQTTTETTGEKENETVTTRTTTKKKMIDVTVSITYTHAVLTISQTRGKQPFVSDDKSFSLDTSAGFEVRMDFADGTGATKEGDGDEWSSETRTLFGRDFGVHDDLEHLILSQTHNTKGEGLKHLIETNAQFTDQNSATFLEESRKWYSYRQQLRAKEKQDEGILSSSFWSRVYNNPEQSYVDVCEQIKTVAPRLSAAQDQQSEMFDFFRARLGFVNQSKAHLYWFRYGLEQTKFCNRFVIFNFAHRTLQICLFSFWNDFWLRNHKKEALRGKAAVFGFANARAVIYNPVMAPALMNMLEAQNILGKKDEKPHYLFLEVIDRLYKEMGRCHYALELTYVTKKAMKTADWQQKLVPKYSKEKLRKAQEERRQKAIEKKERQEQQLNVDEDQERTHHDADIESDRGSATPGNATMDVENIEEV
jgi:hypothetical protein